MSFLKELTTSLFPMDILTDEKIEHDKQMKQQADEAAKKAKQAANLEGSLDSLEHGINLILILFKTL